LKKKVRPVNNISDW